MSLCPGSEKPEVFLTLVGVCRRLPLLTQINCSYRQQPSVQLLRRPTEFLISRVSETEDGERQVFKEPKVVWKVRPQKQNDVIDRVLSGTCGGHNEYSNLYRGRKRPLLFFYLTYRIRVDAYHINKHGTGLSRISVL